MGREELRIGEILPARAMMEAGWGSWKREIS
jgi:hypothetical protein